MASFVFSVVWYDDCLLFFESFIKIYGLLCFVMKNRKNNHTINCGFIFLLVRNLRNKKKASKNEEKVKEELIKSMVANNGLDSIDLSEKVNRVTKYEEAASIVKDHEKIYKNAKTEYNLLSLQTRLLF